MARFLLAALALLACAAPAAAQTVDLNKVGYASCRAELAVEGEVRTLVGNATGFLPQADLASEWAMHLNRAYRPEAGALRNLSCPTFDTFEAALAWARAELAGGAVHEDWPPMPPVLQAPPAPAN